jgi:hypothetical protein
MLSALGRITPSANPPYDLPADHYFTFADYCAAALSAREISIEKTLMTAVAVLALTTAAHAEPSNSTPQRRAPA